MFPEIVFMSGKVTCTLQLHLVVGPRHHFKTIIDYCWTFLILDVGKSAPFTVAFKILSLLKLTSPSFGFDFSLYTLHYSYLQRSKFLPEYLNFSQHSLLEVDSAQKKGQSIPV